MRFVSLCFALLLPSLSFAAPEIRARKPSTAASTVFLDDVSLNGAAGTRTFQVNMVLGFDLLVLYLKYDHDSNAGTITTACTVSDDGNTDDYQPTTCDVASGTCTLSMAGTFVTASLSADTNFQIVLGITGSRDVECVVTHGGTPGADEKITVSGYATTSGR
jgi:hypothetical protein